jgi:hypothetical protein
MSGACAGPRAERACALETTGGVQTSWWYESRSQKGGVPNASHGLALLGTDPGTRGSNPPSSSERQHNSIKAARPGATLLGDFG